MNEEIKQAFRNVARSHDGDVIRDYLVERVRELSDVRNATPENFIARGLSATYIEKEILSLFTMFDERIQEVGNDDML